MKRITWLRDPYNFSISHKMCHGKLLKYFEKLFWKSSWHHSLHQLTVSLCAYFFTASTDWILILLSFLFFTRLTKAPSHREGRRWNRWLREEKKKTDWWKKEIIEKLEGTVRQPVSVKRGSRNLKGHGDAFWNLENTAKTKALQAAENSTFLNSKHGWYILRLLTRNVSRGRDSIQHQEASSSRRRNKQGGGGRKRKRWRKWVVEGDGVMGAKQERDFGMLKRC